MASYQSFESAHKGFSIKVWQEPANIFDPTSELVWKAEVRDYLNVITSAATKANSQEEAEFAATELIDSWN